MNTYKYCCLNSDCENNSFQYIKKEATQINHPEFCISCKSPIKLMGEVVSGGLTGKFRNATPAQRKQMLLQRSTAHFKRSDLSDRKHEIGEAYKKEAISIAKGEI